MGGINTRADQQDHRRGHLAMLAFSALVAGSFSLGAMVANDIDPAAVKCRAVSDRFGSHRRHCLWHGGSEPRHVAGTVAVCAVGRIVRHLFRADV